MWPNRILIDRFGIELPIILAPMAGSAGVKLAQAVANAGGLGSLPCAMLTAEQIRMQLVDFRVQTDQPVNLNFFCHVAENDDPDRQMQWQSQLAGYYSEFHVTAPGASSNAGRAPFSESYCELVETLRPEVVSFHFGLPAAPLVARVKAAGCYLLSTATSVAEARWLEERGCDAIIAQGVEAGGHRGVFLSDSIASQVGTLALLPQIVDAVDLPVIAAGGIADGRTMAAALVLGAAAVQIGTAFLLTPEATVRIVHREALEKAAGEDTALTNLFSGRPARGIYNRLMSELGPMSDKAPKFPHAAGALTPLREAAEAQGRSDFTPLWAGQGVGLARPDDAKTLTRRLADDAITALRLVTRNLA